MKKIKTIISCLCILFINHAVAQEGAGFTKINTGIFADAAHHWYDILEKDAVIHPLPGRPRYQATELVAIGENILLLQKENGGWPKNYDIMAILSPAQKDSVLAAKKLENTTFDNGTTYTHVETLAGIYQATKDDRYMTAALKGIDFILSAQYVNGGWPQYFPLEKNYSSHITYNDGAMGGIMELLKDIIEGNSRYVFIDPERMKKIREAWNKGLNCLIKTQINDNGKPTAWCQQHDETTLQPAWARTFEPPCICNGESADLVLLLMSIKKPTPEVISAIDNAVAWFRESAITGIKVKTIEAPVLNTPFTVSKTDKVVVQDSTAPRIWARYYELKTHRPLFCNRNYKMVYSLAEVDRERRDGYGWYTYAPEKVLAKYDSWKKKIALSDK